LSWHIVIRKKYFDVLVLCIDVLFNRASFVALPDVTMVGNHVTSVESDAISMTTEKDMDSEFDLYNLLQSGVQTDDLGESSHSMNDKNVDDFVDLFEFLLQVGAKVCFLEQIRSFPYFNFPLHMCCCFANVLFLEFKYDNMLKSVIGAFRLQEINWLEK